MSITLSVSPIWLIGCVMAAVGIAAYTYYNTPPHVSVAVQYVLGSLRALAVFLVLLLLLQPIALQSETVYEQPVIAVLLDVSRSIPHITNEDQLRSGLSEAIDAMNQLSDDVELRFFTFADNLRSGGTLPENLTAVEFDGHRTNIGGGLLQTEQQFQDQSLSGITLVTDGQANTGPEPIQIARQLVTPIHTVAVGDTARPQAVQIERIQTNERAFVDRETPVRIHLKTSKLAGETIQVRLSRDEAELDATTFTASADGITEEIDLTFTPSESGIYTYLVDVEVLSEQFEADTITNAFALRSLTERRQAMLVAGGPSPQVPPLRQTVEREADLDLISHIEQPDGSFYEGPISTPPDSIDLLILAGYPTARSPAEPLSAIHQILSSNTPAFLLLSQSVDPVALGDLSEYLPIQLEGSLASWQATTVRPAPGAAQHPAFTHASPTGGWEMLPDVRVPRAGWRARANARSLIESTAAIPVVTTREFSAHRSAAVMASNAWQWHNLPPTLDRQRDLWRNFLRDLVQWTLADPADDRVAVSPSRADFHVDEPVTFNVRAQDQQGQPASDASIDLVAYGPDGQAYTTVLNRGPAGVFEGDLGTIPAGTYQFEATAEIDGSEVGGDRGSFTVGAHDPEETFTFADGELLREIATETGGSFSLLDEAYDLPDVIRNQLDNTRQEREEVRERLFWQWPILLAFILALFSVEWFVRKRNGLP